MNERLSKLISLFIVFLTCIGLISIIVVIPLVWYTAVDIRNNPYTIITFVLNELLSIPCFIVLIYGIKASKLIKNNMLYSNETSVIVKRSGLILLVASIVFVLNNLLFGLIAGFVLIDFNQKVEDLMPVMPYFVYVILGASGFAAGFALYEASTLVKDATNLKKENEEFV